MHLDVVFTWLWKCTAGYETHLLKNITLISLLMMWWRMLYKIKGIGLLLASV